jgi:hypothetical protein
VAASRSSFSILFLFIGRSDVIVVIAVDVFNFWQSAQEHFLPICGFGHDPVWGTGPCLSDDDPL